MQPPIDFIFLRQGKVRDVYTAADSRHLLIVASDRISAFDHVLPNPIPGKGIILTRMSNFWFDRTKTIVRNHIVDTEPSLAGWVDDGRWHREQLTQRVVLVRKAEPLPIEAIVRGYLVGSGWKEYRQACSVCGIALPKGLVEADRLPEPIFTPSTKADAGAHDENISFERAADLVGLEIAQKVRDISLRLYVFATGFAEQRGIIIADTKFEFGMVDGELILIDELFTPDSSRFWPADSYQLGISPPSFDKQFVRDSLEKIKWDKQPPAPSLPEDVICKTAEKYQEALKRLTEDKG
ncbi:MAG: phosphoribosylaminoimidazolesuccinocarboxamide synthase [Proteobacteria bacterium]|nr:phosphoribosylaminoimidazolesuccinocarboxamide synthase [Pseudomonadota bacterium]MBU1569995.1 phosphoribosylaminoimidazolesuccinocarboxamide synthase [Pseudomonadota bacterium]